MEANEGESEPATTSSTPENSSPTEQRKVPLADVRRRLEAEKKRIANLRKNRIGSKATSPRSPKGAPSLKRRAERLVANLLCVLCQLRILKAAIL